jgi:hypothetical protein
MFFLKSDTNSASPETINRNHVKVVQYRLRQIRPHHYYAILQSLP